MNTHVEFSPKPGTIETLSDTDRVNLYAETGNPEYLNIDLALTSRQIEQWVVLSPLIDAVCRDVSNSSIRDKNDDYP